MRRNSDKFIRINEEEEPPLRTLNHGLDGEFRQLSACDEDPYPFVIRKADGKCFHGFRFLRILFHISHQSVIILLMLMKY